MQNICGDQTNFYYWTLRAYTTNVEKNFNLEKVRTDIKNCVLNKAGINDIERHMLMVYPFSKYNSDCWKEKVKIRWEIDKVAKYIAENIFFLSIVPKVRLFNLLFPISIIFGILTIIGLIFYFKKDWFIPLSYISMVIIYAMYNPYGLFDQARFKLYVLPFEILLIAQLYKDKIQRLKS
ncbi:MAG: hypothetical protein RMJ38_04405 [candidate division WOR-3 bacterium]|nr:hypothetical protein [candidate division WOR-3 bacterium]MDW8150662.1 hypothetical protein [candidate division WOR-3 bacterium]